MNELRNFDPKNNLPLPRLNLRSKVFFSLLLVTGVLGFKVSWMGILHQVYNPSDGLGGLGIEIGFLKSIAPHRYWALLGIHIAGMVLLLAPAIYLLRLTSMRRRVRLLMEISVVLLILLDLSAWLYAPACSVTNPFVGAIGGLAGIPLLGMALIPLWQMWVFLRWSSNDGRKKRVIIVGGGFAGLYAARGLHRKLGYHQDLEILLLDQNNYFLFPPLLPSAASGAIDHRQVTFPFRRLLENSNIVFRKIEVTNIDPRKQVVRGLVEVDADRSSTSSLVVEVSYDYDYLVLAPGSVTQTFQTPGASEHAYFMRELGDSIALRNRVIDCFERAAAFSNVSAQKEILHFVIVGAGPTGIETATELHDLIHGILLKRYPEIAPSAPLVTIVQSGEEILPGWHEDIVKTSREQLRRLGVQVRFGARVSEVCSRELVLADGSRISSQTVVWCAGVRPSELLKNAGLPQHPTGRVLVDADLTVPGFRNVFVLGDAAHFVDPQSGRALPPLGQVAFQQGSHAAKNLLALLCDQPTKAFHYTNFGGLVSVGEHFAAVQLLGIRLSGFLGWIVWRSLYLGKIVGTSNKLRIMLDWTLDLLIERSFSYIADRPSNKKKSLSPSFESRANP